MKKLRVGDDVCVRPDITVGAIIGKEVVTEEMEQYKGKTTKVIGIDPGGYIALEIDSGTWAWTSEMLTEA